MRDATSFVSYALSFYGPTGLFDHLFHGSPVSESDCWKALTHLRALRAKQEIPFEGDSMDREALRDIMFVQKGMVHPGETEFETGFGYDEVAGTTVEVM